MFLLLSPLFWKPCKNVSELDLELQRLALLEESVSVSFRGGGAWILNLLLVLVVVVVVHTHLVVMQKRRVAAKCILGTETCVEITSCKDEGGLVCRTSAGHLYRPIKAICAALPWLALNCVSKEYRWSRGAGGSNTGRPKLLLKRQNCFTNGKISCNACRKLLNRAKLPWNDRKDHQGTNNQMKKITCIW